MTTQSLADHLFRAIGVALGVEEDFFVDEHRGLWNGTGINMMRTLYYPPIQGRGSGINGSPCITLN